jgi:hypothetical protein
MGNIVSRRPYRSNSHVLPEKALPDLGLGVVGDTKKIMDSIYEGQNFDKNTITGT